MACRHTEQGEENEDPCGDAHRCLLHLGQGQQQERQQQPSSKHADAYGSTLAREQAAGVRSSALLGVLCTLTQGEPVLRAQ